MGAKIYMITGASGVGKTTLLQQLQEDLEEGAYQFYKFDEIGVPPFEEMVRDYGSPSAWQKAKTVEWIEILIRKAAKNTTSIIFEGQMNLDFIIEGFKEHKFTEYKIILIDCEAGEIKRRLIEERNQPELANADMVNWLKFLRKQGQQYEVAIINTANKTVEEVGQHFKEIIQS